MLKRKAFQKRKRKKVYLNKRKGCLNATFFLLLKNAACCKIKIVGFFKRKSMATWKSRGLRGSTLEEMINRTNEKYREDGLALIQKVPTPITPIEIDQKTRHITLAYFDQKSTVDYIGAVQGIPVCFDAKESANETFALQNIHEHQYQFMEDFEAQGGIAFFLIYYTSIDELYYLPFEYLKLFWERAKNGGRKSFRHDELNPAYVIPKADGVLVPYLETLKIDLEDRE